MTSKWESIHDWATERFRQTEFEPPTEDGKKTVIIKKKSDVTFDMVIRPNNYNIVIQMRRCGICGEAGHNSRGHRSSWAL